MSFLIPIKNSYCSTPKSCHQNPISSELLNKKIVKLIKSKLFPLKSPIKKVRKNNHFPLLSKIIFNNQIYQKNTLASPILKNQDQDKMIQSTHSFTDIQRSANTKAKQYIKKRRKYLKSLQVFQQQSPTKQNRPLSIIKQCIKLFETQMKLQKNKLDQQKIKTANKTIILQNDSQIKNSIFMTQDLVSIQNKTIKKEILQDIKKQFDQEKSSNIRISMNHKKIINRFR